MESASASVSRVRVLLTGAAGFGGSHSLRHLLKNTDWFLICPVTFSHRGLPERLTWAVEDPASWERVSVVKWDLSIPIDERTSRLIGPIDYIINYASESHVDRSISTPLPVIQNNVDLILNLLEFARTAKPKTFLQISTDEVYGPPPANYKHKEWDSIVSSNPYSASKAAQEAIAISYWATHGVPLLLVNSMNLIGETQDPEKFVSKVISKVLRGEEVTIHASNEGTMGSRFYLHARNLADAVLFLLKRGAPRLYSLLDGIVRPERWNAVGEREVGNLEMAKLIAKFMGKPLHFKLLDPQSYRPGHDFHYGLDGTKLRTAGWKISTSFDDSLREMIQWTLEHNLWAERVEIENGNL